MTPKTFILTQDHLDLLKKAYVTWWDCEYGSPAIDPKRPYGNSDVEEDVCLILKRKPKDGRHFSAEQLMEANHIHLETEHALQIVLSTGSFSPGTYRSDGYGGNWTRISD